MDFLCSSHFIRSQEVRRVNSNCPNRKDELPKVYIGLTLNVRVTPISTHSCHELRSDLTEKLGPKLTTLFCRSSRFHGKKMNVEVV